MNGLARAAVVIVAMVLLLPACSESGGIGVEDAWARSPMQDVGAAYFTVANEGDAEDRLIDATAEIADRTEIHETVIEDGQAEMRPIEGVAIPAGETMAFEPGGYHVMLFDLAESLTVGETISLVLTFEEAGEIEVEAEIREFVEGEMENGMGGDTGSET
jgi:periplasmic copper chaperone A